MSLEANGLELLQTITGPWYESLENPQKAQEKKLSELITLYSKTEYGKSHNASKIGGIT